MSEEKQENIIDDMEFDSSFMEWDIYKTEDDNFVITSTEDTLFLTPQLKVKHIDDDFLIEEIKFSSLDNAEETIEIYTEENNSKGIISTIKGIFKKDKKEETDEEEVVEETEYNSENALEENEINEEEEKEEPEKDSSGFLSGLFGKKSTGEEESEFDEEESDSSTLEDDSNEYDESDEEPSKSSSEEEVSEDVEEEEVSEDVEEEEVSEDVEEEEVSEDVEEEESSGFLSGLFGKNSTKEEEEIPSDNLDNESEEESKNQESDIGDSVEEEFKEKTSILTKIKKFLSTEIADIDQERPDAQNVSIDYLRKTDEGWKKSKHLEKFFDKLRKSREGDEVVKRDIYVDLKKRYWNLIKYNPYARGDMGDVFISTLLTLMGALIVFVGLFSIFIGDVSNMSVLTGETSYGDHLMVSTILLGIASISFWLSRRAKSKTIVSAIRIPARLGVIILLSLQLVVVAFVSYSLLFGGGQEALLNIELTLDEYVESGLAYLPMEAQEPLSAAYESYRGPESTVFGLSIMQSALFMTLVGIITAYPVVKRTIARFVLTANLTPREFREQTGILIEEIASDDEDTYTGPKYVMGEGKVGEGNEDGEIIEYKESFEDESELEDSVDNLLQLPENIRRSPYANYEEVRRYWVNEPYAYVSIVYDENSNDYRYVVVEPELTDSDEAIYDELQSRLDNELIFEDVEEKEDEEKQNEIKIKKLEKRIMKISKEYGIDVQGKSFQRILYYIERNYIQYNKIDPLLNDRYVEDISCDGEEQYIFIFHKHYKDVITNIRFGKDELRSFIKKLAQRSGEHISAADPMVDASLPDGSRAQMTLGTEVTTAGSTFTIRLFEETPFTPVDLLDYNTFSLMQMAYLWTSIQHNKSLIFAGGTASGKTTSMNAVSLFIPPKSKVITIEDTREIKLPQKNWIPGTTRDGLGDDSSEIDMYSLLVAALRQRPEYIVVGEIRGEEAETLFQAMNTGHTTYSTMHAETADAAIGRLTNPPINVPKQMITALDIVCIQNQIRFTDENGHAKNVRRNEETREIVGLKDNGSFRNRRPFQWDAETDTFITSLDSSNVLARISEENGWTREELEEQLRQRKEVLEYMLDEDIREFEKVAKVIQAYMVDSENVIRKVRNDALDPDKLTNLTDMEWKDEEDSSLNKMAKNGDNI